MNYSGRKRHTAFRLPLTTFQGTKGTAWGFIVAGLACCTLCFSPAWAAKKPVKASQQEIVLSEKLRQRERQVAEKEEQLARREQELKSLEKEVDAKLERLLALQAEVKLKLDELKAVKDKRFKNLVKVYSSMSASKAAALLNQMDDQDALEIMKALKPDQVAKIMPKLDPEKAVRLSRELGLL